MCPLIPDWRRTRTVRFSRPVSRTEICTRRARASFGSCPKSPKNIRWTRTAREVRGRRERSQEVRLSGLGTPVAAARVGAGTAEKLRKVGPSLVPVDIGKRSVACFEAPPHALRLGRPAAVRELPEKPRDSRFCFVESPCLNHALREAQEQVYSSTARTESGWGSPVP